jgi:lipopolysaccharide transport system ATP-binding protein
MSSEDIAIRVTSLSKRYEIYDAPSDRLKQFVLPRLQLAHRRYFREFWALQDASFEVKKGETVGIIGRNGSGKSTLLQMICGTLSPTSGEIQVNGRVAALLELGAGFNPEFTGRENVYMNGMVLGLSEDEIDARFDDIASFADIGEFIEQPVKTYSSGMSLRLAFAVIAHVDADILVIDEALAVGDTFFQQKCMRFLHNFQENCGSVLFVSHDTGAVVSLCDRAILLAAGSVSYCGDTEHAIKIFLEELYADPARQLGYHGIEGELSDAAPEYSSEAGSIRNRTHVFEGVMSQETHYVVSKFRPNAERFGNGKASIIDAGFFENNNLNILAIKGGQTISFFIRVDVHKPVKYPAFGLMIKNSLGEYVFTEGTDLHFRQHDLLFRKGDLATATFTFMMPHLSRGTYMINVAFAEGQGDSHIQHCWLHDAIQLDVTSSRLAHGYCGMNDISMTVEVVSPEQIECQ